jgi:guanosine-3',5'-bis(diphosphate) 3'-pyrophosphohydrolase
LHYDEDDLGLVVRALEFAAGRHRDQRRKDAEATPYVNHPIEVAGTLWRVGGVRDVVTLVAAILHDTVEDTDATGDEVEALFGAEVASLVLEVSDDKSLPRAERKRLQIVHAPQASERARLIKLADKICNVRDMGHSPPADWSPERLAQYLDWSAQVVAGLRETSRALESCFYETLREARAMVSS